MLEVWARDLVRRKRVVLGAIALSGFVSLFVFARLLAIDFSIAGLSGRTLHAIGHVVVYGGLAVVTYHALNGWFMAGWWACALVSTAEEYHQLFVPGRVPAMRDVALNLATITCCLVFVHYVLPGLGRQPQPQPSG